MARTEINLHFYKSFFHNLKGFEVDHIVVAGDMNFIIDHKTDCLNYARENNENARRAFLQLADDFNLIDRYIEIFHPNQSKCTWSRKKFKCDCFDISFISEHLISNVETQILYRDIEPTITQ